MSEADARRWEFRRVRPGSRVWTPVSPALPDAPDFQGIRIDALSRVTFAPGEPLRLIVTAAMRVEEGAYNAPCPPERVLFVGVNAATHEARAGVIPRRPHRIGRRDPPTRDPDLLVGYFFNPDLGAALRLPSVEARYFIHATFGDHVSNVLRVSVEPLDRGEQDEVCP